MIPSCRTLILNLTESEERDVPWLERAGVKVHLSFCGECTRFVTQSTLVRAALAGMPAEPVSPQTKALLMERFRTWRAGRNGKATGGPRPDAPAGEAADAGDSDPSARGGRRGRS